MIKKNKKNSLKIRKLKIILYPILSRLPVSRRNVDKLRLQVVELFCAYRELQMLTQQNVATLTGKMMELHSTEFGKGKNKRDIDPTKQMKKPKTDNENMYG